MKRITAFFLGLTTLCLFTNSAWVDLTLIRPARISLPQHIKKLALVDFTVQEETRKNKLEQTLTGELFKQDEQAVRETADGIIDICKGFGLFEIIRTGERVKGTGTKTTFPQPLSWDEVESYCEKYNADALIAIEIFDSDFILTGVPGNIPAIADVSRIPEIRLKGTAVVNIGIRIYDPKGKIIIDEYKTTERINTGGGGAVEQILNKTDAINYVSYQVGSSYGTRISPTYYTVRRYFFNKPKRNKDLKKGVRKSEIADWKGAIESWTKCVNGKKKKPARRAAFNIAVAYEVLKDLDKAKEWAGKAYTEYGEKEAEDYYDKLSARVREEVIVNEQLGGR